MAKDPKSPPLLTWRQLPLGFHLLGERQRVLAHVWPGRDQQWRGCSVDASDPLHEPINYGPWPTAFEAKREMERIFS